MSAVPGDGLHVVWDDTESAWIVFRVHGQEITTLGYRGTSADAVALMEAYRKDRQMDVQPPPPEALAVIYLRQLDEVARDIQRSHPTHATRPRMARIMLDGALRKLSPPEAVVVQFPRAPMPSGMNALRGMGAEPEPFDAGGAV